MNQTWLYRSMGIGATLAALLISVADFLLEFSPEYGVSSEIVEPAWESMAGWRFTSSIYLCAFLIPFYIPGFYLLYRSLRKQTPKMALTLFVLFSYGVIMGSPLIHTVMSMNPVIYKFGLSNGLEPKLLEDLIGGEITGAIFPVFITHYFLTWVLAPILLFVVIIRGATPYRRWVAFINPLVFLLVGMLGLQVLPGIFKYLTPGAINKANCLLFLVLALRYRKGDPDGK